MIRKHWKVIFIDWRVNKSHLDIFYFTRKKDIKGIIEKRLSGKIGYDITITSQTSL